MTPLQVRQHVEEHWNWINYTWPHHALEWRLALLADFHRALVKGIN